MLCFVSVGVKVNPKGRGESDVQKNKIRGMQNDQLQHTNTYSIVYIPHINNKYTYCTCMFPLQLVFTVQDFKLSLLYCVQSISQKRVAIEAGGC